MTTNNNSSDNWKPLNGSVVAPFGANKETPDMPQLMPEKTVDIFK